jgi:nucleotide-binding universal stress UspA family protein
MDLPRQRASNGNRPFTIVVGNDFDVASGYAFDQGMRLSLRIPGSHMHVVHVERADAPVGRTARLASMLQIYAAEKYAADGGAGRLVSIHVKRGDPARELVQFAVEVSADVILVGSRGRPRLREFFSGSMIARLSRGSPCPLLVAGGRRETIEPPSPECARLQGASSGRTWRDRVPVELLELGTQVGKRTLQRYLDGSTSWREGQRWASLLRTRVSDAVDSV